MASTVYDVEEIELRDGKTVKLKPLSIRELRLFMDVMGKTANTATEDEALQVLIEACGVALEKQIPEIKENKDLLRFESNITNILNIIETCFQDPLSKNL